MTYLERPAPGVSLDSWLMEGASCLRPLEQSVLNSSIAARSVEDVVREVSDRKSVINPVTDVNSENLHMRISPDPVPLEQSVPRASSECYEQSYTDASDDMNTDLPESLTPMLKPLTAFEWPCVNSPLLPTAKPEVVNQRKDSFDMNTNLTESSTPMIDSDLSIENWEDGYCRRLGYAGEVSPDLLNVDSSEPKVENRRKTADLTYVVGRRP